MSNIDSPQNKALLWNVLLENGSFAGIPETKINEVNRLLNAVVEEMGKNDEGVEITIMELNKCVLAEMSRRLSVYRESIVVPNTVTSREDLQKERIDRMNEMAKKMSIDMSQYAPKKPKSVRFSDDVDKLSPEILESRLEQAIASRNLDMLVDVSGGNVKDTVKQIPSQRGSSDQDMYQDMYRMYGEVKRMYTEMRQMAMDLEK